MCVANRNPERNQLVMSDACRMAHKYHNQRPTREDGGRGHYQQEQNEMMEDSDETIKRVWRGVKQLRLALRPPPSGGVGEQG